MVPTSISTYFATPCDVSIISRLPLLLAFLALLAVTLFGDIYFRCSSFTYRSVSIGSLGGLTLGKFPSHIERVFALDGPYWRGQLSLLLLSWRCRGGQNAYLAALSCLLPLDEGCSDLFQFHTNFYIKLKSSPRILELLTIAPFHSLRQLEHSNIFMESFRQGQLIECQ